MCTMKKIGKGEVIEKLASKLTLKKVFDTKVECCGFAGDKGFFTPELNLSATKNMKFIDPSIKRAYSTSSTCEIGLSHASKRQFLNIAYLVDECLI